MRELVFVSICILVINISTSHAGMDAKHEESFTVSSFHLLLTIIGGTYEKKLTEKISYTVGLGGGRSPLLESYEETTASMGGMLEHIFDSSSYERIENARVYVFDCNMGYRYILLGKFNHNLHLAGEVVAWVVQSSYDIYDEHDRFKENEISRAFTIGLSPMIGYKFATNKGFTIEIEIGPLGGYSLKTKESKIFPYGDINIGWSF